MVVQNIIKLKDRGWVDGWLDEDDDQPGDPFGFDFRNMSFN